MTKIECILRPDRISEVSKILGSLGIKGMTVTEVIGCGLQKGHIRDDWNTEFKINLLPKTKIEMVVSDSMVDDVVNAVIKISRTGEIGDGKIFTYPLGNAIRIRTGETGEDAI
ncbi:regulatory protein P-II for glutamine synthetase [Syntrophobacter sp. SbD1]|nr:regulatory protein P-II for glutamine synthetase [Syntrophobacter sp. SbD1]